MGGNQPWKPCASAECNLCLGGEGQGGQLLLGKRTRACGVKGWGFEDLWQAAGGGGLLPTLPP